MTTQGRAIRAYIEQYKRWWALDYYMLDGLPFEHWHRRKKLF